MEGYTKRLFTKSLSMLIIFEQLFQKLLSIVLKLKKIKYLMCKIYCSHLF